MIALSPGRVLVEFIETTRLTEQDGNRLARLLSEEERTRAARFHFERDRQVYVAGHALMRDMLARATGREPGQWQFVTGLHGKPEAIQANGEPRLRVNLSHTQGLAAVALTLESDIGVDVEWMARETAFLDLAARFFSPEEKKRLEVTPQHAQRAVFFTLWTLKEAFIKAVGLGLSMPLADFTFDPAGPSISFAPHVRDDPLNWSFWCRNPTDAHSLALAVRRHGQHEPQASFMAADLPRLLRV